MNGNDDQQDPARKLCTQRPQTEQANKQWLIEQSAQINPIPLWRWSLSQQGLISTLMPNSLPNQHLLDMGISLAPRGFPAGFKETDLANYDQIVDAFSHCFNPGLFDVLNMPDPYAAWPYQQTYWDVLFKILKPAGFTVQVDKRGGGCFGVDGQVQGLSMQIYDCTGAPDIFHEIGHIVMNLGILGSIPPLYYRYVASTHRYGIGPMPGSPQAGIPNIPQAGVPNIPQAGTPDVIETDARTIDAIEELNRLFGNYTQQGKDTDGLKFGFVSNYALTNKNEDFADTFKYYVYYPDDAFPRATRQLSQGSSLLSEKLSYISYLFKGMTFSNGGVVDNWPGYPL